MPQNDHTESFAAAQRSLCATFGTQAKSRFVRLGHSNTKAHVLEAGQGDPVVMFPAGPFPAASMAPLMSLLQNDFRLYAVDRPGCGLTDPLPLKRSTFRDQWRWFTEDVLDSLGLARPAIVGASLGGYLGILLGLASPARVACLTLLGPPPGIDHQIPVPLRLLSVPYLNRLLWSTVAKPTPEGVAELFKQSFVADVNNVSSDYIGLLAIGLALPNAGKEWLSTIRMLTSLAGMTPDSELFNDLPGLTCATSMLWGELDQITPPSRGIPPMSVVPDIDINVIRGAGHLLWFDAPQHTAQLVREFVGARTSEKVACEP